MTDAEPQFDQLVARVASLPPAKAAREVRAHFSTLPEPAARALVTSRTDRLGGLDGVPAELRYQANHLRLVAARERLRDRIAGGRASRDEVLRFNTLTEMLQPVGQRLDVDAEGNRIVVPVHRQFLLVQPEGQGRMVEVLGDLARAEQVAVLVPGMNNDLDKVRSQLARAQDLQTEAGPGSATIVWLGYDAPLGLEAAMSKQRSIEAAPLLARFAAGLDTEVAPGTDRTLIGNSYGGQVAGQAMLREQVRFDRVILTGCPGIDPGVRSAADFVPPGVQLFVARAPGDYISYAEPHGPDPASFPDAIRFETNDGTVAVRGHLSYFEYDSESLRNIGRIIRGDLAAVTRTSTTAEEESRVLPGVSWAEPLRQAAASPAAVPLAKVFDGVRALGKISSPPPRPVTDGVRARRAPGPGVSKRPEGPTR
ncbi:alpha/beta hydrolase [Kribbella sp. ALI-6-A]|uniref:alpha/beta hydrolase n=1 Tax=Kribbella sp. ALI-6-A TaxID=1933817 RepID=UPI00143D67CA|nr:alpha/beta hydrolase [Kribbella sp. ALI-6-A]